MIRILIIHFQITTSQKPSTSKAVDPGSSSGSGWTEKKVIKFLIKNKITGYGKDVYQKIIKNFPDFPESKVKGLKMLLTIKKNVHFKGQ